MFHKVDTIIFKTMPFISQWPHTVHYSYLIQFSLFRTAFHKVLSTKCTVLIYTPMFDFTDQGLKNSILLLRGVRSIIPASLSVIGVCVHCGVTQCEVSADLSNLCILMFHGSKSAHLAEGATVLIKNLASGTNNKAIKSYLFKKHKFFPSIQFH